MAEVSKKAIGEMWQCDGQRTDLMHRQNGPHHHHHPYSRRFKHHLPVISDRDVLCCFRLKWAIHCPTSQPFAKGGRNATAAWYRMECRLLRPSMLRTPAAMMIAGSFDSIASHICRSTSHFALLTALFTLHTSHFTLHSSHSRLHFTRRS